MRVRFDQEADALHIRLDRSPVFESEEIRPGVALDLDEWGEVIGLEMLRVSQRLPTATRVGTRSVGRRSILIAPLHYQCRSFDVNNSRSSALFHRISGIADFSFPKLTSCSHIPNRVKAHHYGRL